MCPSTTTLFHNSLRTFKHTKHFDHKGHYQLRILKYPEKIILHINVKFVLKKESHLFRLGLKTEM